VHIEEPVEKMYQIFHKNQTTDPAASNSDTRAGLRRGATGITTPGPPLQRGPP